MQLTSTREYIWLRNKIADLFQDHSMPSWVIFSFDSVFVFLSFLFAYLLRFNFVLQDITIPLAFKHAVVALIVYVGFSLIFKYYSGLLRHTTVIDIVHIFTATSLSFTFLMALTLVGRFIGINLMFILPISVIMIHNVLITVILFTIRIFTKTVYYYVSSSVKPKKHVLIYGADNIGIAVKRVLLSDHAGEYQVMGFIEKNKQLQGKKINGIPVFSPAILTPRFLEKSGIKTLIFAVNGISPSEKRQIIRAALNLGLEVRETPALDKWLNGQLEIGQIRKIDLLDLLGREPIELNMKRVGIGLSNKTIMVTGAAGSIGSEIARQLMRFNIKKLILVDQAETPMFHLESELRKKCNSVTVKVILADITNYQKMKSIFYRHQPEIVFHAAAYKHVPLIEDNPHEALRVNVGGTMCITDLAVKYGVKKFVMISTDKAVNPTNVMGTSKRICELVVQYKAQQPDVNTQFITTRFGNVLGSNGSVIPLFSKQIEEGGPVTVTHPEITRYFMTIPEACELVLEAGFMGKGGEIFMFDMGQPVRIADLARQMIRLSGLIPDQDIKIEFTGLRPGEKLYEELLSDHENTLPTHHPRIKVAKVYQGEDKMLWTYLENVLEKLYSFSNNEIVTICKDLVPEFNTTNQQYMRLFTSEAAPK